MLSRSHPKLVSRGAEVADADLKFKGAPSDDCDPFAIQNYIDRLASEIYDSIHGTQAHANKNQEEKDEWELMKEKARRVPFQDVTLSIALKHGLMDEVKKENANTPFEKDNILTIMKVREEFIQDYPNASSFEYQWQIWVEWERYLKQIGVTIPQWGKVARKLIRLGVIRIQEDMTKKYSQISAGSNKRKASEEHTVPEKKKRGMAPHIDTRSCASAGFNHYITSTIERNPHGSEIVNPFSPGSGFAPISPSYSNSPYGTPQSPFGTPQSSPFSTPGASPFSTPQTSPVSYRTPVSPFGASLYNMIATQTTTAALFTSQMPFPLQNAHSPSPFSVGASQIFDVLPYPHTSLQEYSTSPFVYSTPYTTVSQSQPTYTSSLSPSPVPSPSMPPSPSPQPSPSLSPSPSPSSVTSSPAYSPAYSPSTACHSPSVVFIPIHPDNIPVQLLDPPIHQLDV